MKILVSAGPTQEPIDSVRFITNASSGRMGIALARAAVKAGHKVTVVLGPVGFKPRLKSARIVDVRTASEMADAVLGELEKGFDVFVSAAAVGDYTPERPLRGKISSHGRLVLKLKPTRKITRLAKAKYPGILVVAFKAEFNVTKRVLVERAVKKMDEEGLDAIIANDVGRHRMGSSKTSVYFIDRGRNVACFSGRKSALAGRVMRAVTRLPAT